MCDWQETLEERIQGDLQRDCCWCSLKWKLDFCKRWAYLESARWLRKVIVLHNIGIQKDGVVVHGD